MPRLYIAGSKGKRALVLKKRETHYLRDVLRMKRGDRITVFDGEEGEGYIEDISNNNVNIAVKNWKKAARGIGVSIVLGQSILKGEKMELVLEKAAEIGVDSIIPLVTERVIPRQNRDEKIRRWERIVIEASRLCGRTMPPKISAPVSLKDFSKMNLAGFKILPWEGEKETMLFSLLNAACGIKDVLVVMGPEGGLSQEEAGLLREAGFKTVSLGQLILRSDTASIFTLSCIAGFYSERYLNA